MAGPEERGGRVAGGSGEAQAQGQPRDSVMAPMQPSLGPPRDEPRVFGLDKAHKAISYLGKRWGAARSVTSSHSSVNQRRDQRHSFSFVILTPGIEAAALGASESALPGTVPVEALHTFILDSGASRYFFRDSTTLTPLSAPVLVRLADPPRGPVLSRSSTVLPCPAVPSGSLSGLHLPLISMNLVSTAALQDAMVTTTTPRAASAQVSASNQVAPPYSCRLLSHQTLLWHHCLGHPPNHAFVACTPASLSLVFPGLCLPSRPRLPRPAFLASRGGSASLLTPPRFPRQQLPCKLFAWTCAAEPASVDRAASAIFAVRLQLRERFRQDLSVLRLHSVRGGEFSSDLLQDLCHGEGILQSFTLLASPQQNGIAERRIGLVMEVTRTSVIHAVAPRFLWPFAVPYTAHQLNLWPRVSLLETLPTLRWTGEVGDASVFRVWGSRAFVCDTSADKLSACAISCVFLGFPPDAPSWRFYHPTSRRVFPSKDVTFDESVPFYRLFPYRSAPPPPPPLFLALGPPPVEPLPPQGPAPSGVSQVDPLPGTVLIEYFGTTAVDSGAPRGAVSGDAVFEGAELVGAEPGGAEPGGAEPGGTESEGAGSGGAELGGVRGYFGTTAVDSGAPRGAVSGDAVFEGAELVGAEPGGAEPGGAEPGGTESEGAGSGGAKSEGAGSGDAEPAGVESGGAEPEGVEPGGAGPRGTTSSGGHAGASPLLSLRPEPLSPQQLREWFTQRKRLRSGAAGAGASAARDTDACGVSNLMAQVFFELDDRLRCRASQGWWVVMGQLARGWDVRAKQANVE
ncbi:unnamed protein product [Closterium sp. NIES-54]